MDAWFRTISEIVRVSKSNQFALSAKLCACQSQISLHYDCISHARKVQVMLECKQTAEKSEGSGDPYAHVW